MYIEDELRLKSILEKRQKKLIDFLNDCKKFKKLLNNHETINTGTISEAIKDIDVIEQFLYGKIHFKSIESEYSDLLETVSRYNEK